MKIGFVLIMITSLLSTVSTNCGKSSAAKTSLEGSWELRETAGGMMPGSTLYGAGNGTTLKFSGTTYERFEKGALVGSGKFSIVDDSTVSKTVCLEIPAGEYKQRIVYHPEDPADKVFFKISGNRLKLIMGCYALDSGRTIEYEKIDE